MPPSLPVKKKPASPAKKPSGSVKKPAGPAKKPAGPAKKPAGPAKKQAGPAKKQAGPAKKQAGPLKKPAGSVKKPAGPAKKQAGTSKKQAGHVKKPAGPVRKAPYYRATSGDGIGEWKLYGIKVTNPWYKDTKYVLSAPVSEGTILPVGLVGVRGEFDVRPVKGKGVFVSVHLKNDLSGLWEPRKGGIRVKLGTKKGLLLSPPPKDAFLQGDRIKKIVKEILEKINESKYGTKTLIQDEQDEFTPHIPKHAEQGVFSTCDPILLGEMREIDLTKLDEQEKNYLEKVLQVYQTSCLNGEPDKIAEEELRKFSETLSKEDDDEF